MNTKSLFAAAAMALSLAVAMPATDARADVDIDIGLGFGVVDGYYGHGHRPGWYGGGYGYFPNRPYRYGYRDGWYEDDFVTCRQGRKILYRFGYYDIETANCRAPHYKYVAWKKGRQFMIRMNTSGEIARISRIH
jgi:hypothetical protein